MPAAGGERDDRPAAGETDNIGHPIAVDIAEEARDLVLAGPATRGAAEIAQLQSWCPKMPAAGGERDDHPGAGKTDNVVHPIAVDIAEEARDLVLAGPATRAGAEIAQVRKGRPKMP